MPSAWNPTKAAHNWPPGTALIWPAVSSMSGLVDIPVSSHISYTEPSKPSKIQTSTEPDERFGNIDEATALVMHNRTANGAAPISDAEYLAGHALEHHLGIALNLIAKQLPTRPFDTLARLLPRDTALPPVQTVPTLSAAESLASIKSRWTAMHSTTLTDTTIN